VNTVLFGGEQVDPQWPREVLRRGAPRRLLHVYGPTEATTFATWNPVDQNRSERTIPVGNPINNTKVHLLAGDLNLAPLEGVGELCIGGEGLAHCYLGRPDFTADAFIPDPFASLPGGRLYRTGDLARRGQDGRIEFTGRLDNQIKLRGFRIEPAEIESVLRRHKLVQDAVVSLHVDSQGNNRLVAYVVTDSEKDVSFDLRTFLKGKLPAFMLPAHFVVLTSLPLSPNGKVDRKRLPAPDVERRDQAEPYVAPRSEVEQAVAGMWSDLLRMNEIGVHDNFFELGGHSLMITKLISRINDTFGVSLRLQNVFESPSIEGVSEAIVAAESKPGRSERVARLSNQINRMTPEQVESLLDEKHEGATAK
ncbi:MAG: phosphopantetheine-binding protein, partial [Blastocatellia bacterium]